MDDQSRSTAFERFLGVVTAMTLLGALAGGVLLVLRATHPAYTARAEFAVVGTPGVVAALGLAVPGTHPFTEPVAVDLDLDPLTLALPPLNARAAESPHRRGSSADRLIAGAFGRELIRRRDAGGLLGVAQIVSIAEDTFGPDATLTELLDTDRDRFDDDGRFSLTAADGSAVCVTVGERRAAASALALVFDPVDGIPASGVSWSPYGPCGSSRNPGVVSDVRVGTTPGTYGGLRTGDVCDLEALAGALASSELVSASWAAVVSIEPVEIPHYLETLTPVLLLRDTLVTDHGFDNGRILPTQVVLQRGTAVLVDRTGMPRVRCVSGSPLSRPRSLTEGVRVEGGIWAGFSLSETANVPPAPTPVTRFVLVDVRSGEPLVRASGAAGEMSVLAGPVIVASG